MIFCTPAKGTRMQQTSFWRNATPRHLIRSISTVQFVILHTKLTALLTRSYAQYKNAGRGKVEKPEMSQSIQSTSTDIHRIDFVFPPLCIFRVARTQAKASVRQIAGSRLSATYITATTTTLKRNSSKARDPAAWLGRQKPPRWRHQCTR